MNSIVVSWPNTGRIKLYTNASMPLLGCDFVDRKININQHADVVDIKFFENVFRRKEWADRQTVDE